MHTTENRSQPDFLHGAEVARYDRNQVAFDQQLSLIKQESELVKKLKIAALVILAVFVAGMIAGAVAGFYI